MDLGAQMAERVMVLRRRKHLTQAQLATKVGVHWNTVARVEQGKLLDVSALTLARIAQEVGTSTDYLLGLTDLDEPAAGRPSVPGEGLPHDLD
jgi:transcriptional regulator with XRE-family HTH domain